MKKYNQNFTSMIGQMIMTRLIIISIILVGISQNLLSQQIEILSPSKYGVWNLTDVDKSGGKDFMCGDGGLLLTGDATAVIDLHEKVELGDIGSEMLIDIAFNSKNNGTIVCSGGKILSTADNGKTWTKTVPDSTDFLTSVMYISDDIAVITAMNGTLYRSVNSGVAWQKIKLNTDINIRAAAAKNSTVLVTGDIGFLAKSTDNGVTWSASSKSYLGSIYSIASTGNSFILGSGSGLYYSSDDGITWTRASQPDGLRAKIVKALNNDAFAVTDSGTIYRSGDGGKNWTLVSSPGYSINGMHILSNTTWLNVGENSTAQITTDNGKFYSDYLPATNNHYASIAPAIDGSSLVFSTLGKIIKKSATNLLEDLSPLPSGFYRKSILVGNSIYALEEKGTILVSDDNGATWKEHVKISGSVVCNDFAIADNILFVACTNGDMYRYGNSQWTVKKIKDSLNLTTLRFFDKDFGFVCGSFGKIYFTTNSGNTWTESSTPSTVMITDADVHAGNIAFACGFKGEIFKTTDKGASWVKTNDNSVNENLTAIKMHSNTLSGIAATSTGKLIYTENAFKTWKIIFEFRGLIMDISITGDEFLAVGQHSLIAGGKLAPVSVEETITGNSIKIYPNPSTGAFTLSIQDTDVSSGISLSIIDNLGIEKLKLVDKENLKKSEYNFDVHSSNLPSGKYAVLLKSGKLMVAQPLVIIR
ncbi:MAG: hypothetical protein HYZ54_06535 [Ignavibacteriae bacterium]|nr:hypothetical protein [Ignavibacteriota bacterium]